MSSVREIEAAIRALPKTEQRELLQNLHSLFAETDDDLEWKHIANDPRPRPSLSALGMLLPLGSVKIRQVCPKFTMRILITHRDFSWNFRVLECVLRSAC